MFVFNIFDRVRTESLCYMCAYAHRVDSDRGNRLTYCTYGYPVRRIKFDVSDCTFYTTRNCKVTVVRGFIVSEEKAAG